jgi:hypothetical protein
MTSIVDVAHPPSLCLRRLRTPPILFQRLHPVVACHKLGLSPDNATLVFK